MNFAGLVNSSTETFTTAMHHPALYAERFLGLFQYRVIAVLALSASTVGAVALSMAIFATIFERYDDRIDEVVQNIASTIGIYATVIAVNIKVSKMLNLPLSRAVSVIITLFMTIVGGLVIPLTPIFDR